MDLDDQRRKGYGEWYKDRNPLTLEKLMPARFRASHGAHVRRFATTGTSGDKWLVKSGLAAGDRVIVEGIQKVKPGAPAVVAAPANPATASTAAAKPAAVQ